MKVDVIKNRIECINKVHGFINKVAPLIIADIKTNDYKIKSGSAELYKKDAERLKAHLNEKGDLMAFYKYSEYSGLQLFVKDCYKQSELHGGGWGAAYYERTIYLENENGFNPEEIYDVAHMRRQHAKALELMDKAREAEREARAVLYITEGR